MEEEFLRPPRNVPPGVRLRLLFGGFLNQFGWAFFGFGMIFVWIFAVNSDISAILHFRGEIDRTTGTVTRSEYTGWNEGGGDNDSGTPIYRNYYRFTAPDGTEYEGVSYATGRQKQPGAQVTIEYPKGRPDISRIKGMKRNFFGPVGMIAVIFPLAGFFIMLSGFRGGIKGARLLGNGWLALGRLKSKEDTGGRVNDKPIFKMTFEFTADDGGTYEAVAKTHKPWLLEDEEQEILLYDRRNPSSAVMLDSLPGAPTIDKNGRIRTKKGGGVGASLILPVLTVLGHGGYFLLRFVV